MKLIELVVVAAIALVLAGMVCGSLLSLGEIYRSEIKVRSGDVEERMVMPRGMRDMDRESLGK